MLEHDSIATGVTKRIKRKLICFDNFIFKSKKIEDENYAKLKQL